MENIAIISFNVVKATNLAPFTVDGKRNYHFHFFQLTTDGWIFRWIDDDTDVRWLQERIAEGCIYVMP